METTTSLTEEVPTETLDAYCERRQIATAFLKIDVEGNELSIFEGGKNTLQKYQPKILVEIEARHIGEEKAVATFAFLQDLGYEGYFIQGSKQLPLADFSFEQHQNTAQMREYCNNFIFEPAGSR